MAFSFDHSNDTISLTPTTAMNFPDGDWTLSFWANVPNSSNGGDAWGAGDGGISGGFGANTIFASFFDTPSLWVNSELTDSSGSQFIDLTAAAGSFGVWQNFIYQRSGSGVFKLYVDGSEVSSDTNASFADINVVTGGAWDYGFGAFTENFGGDLAEWALWDRALTATERAGLVKGFAPSFYPDSLNFYQQMIREYVELIGDVSVSNSGSTVAPHPPMTYPDGTFFPVEIGIIEHNPTDTMALALSAVATIERELRPSDAIALALAASSTLSGGIFSPTANSALALAASASATGVLYEPANAIAIALASVADIRVVWSPSDSIALALASVAAATGFRYEPADAVALSLGGVASITFGNVVFKWSTEHIEALTTHPYPTLYVDLNSDTAPTGAFPTGSVYERRLLQLPRLEEINLDSRSGVSGFQKVSLVVDNSDGLLNGIEIQDTFARMILVDADGTAFREFKGRVADFSFGHQTTINIEDIDAQAFTLDLPKRTLNDIVELEKIADGGFGANAIADDLGKPITIPFGRNVKMPALYIKADETAREYDYIIGEGTGLNGNNWSEVFTVYRKLKAMDNIGGTAVADTSTTITFETADRKPSEWYQYWWIEITAGTGIGQIRYITTYDETTNKATVDSAWTTGLNGTSVYQLTEWRFYDGSQSTPYAGMACLRFKKRMGSQGRTDAIFVDCDALQDEVDRARAVQSVLSNTVWGLGLSVDTTSFDAASTIISALDSFTCEGNISRVVPAITILSKLLSFRDMVLSKEDEIIISVDETKTSAFNFGLGDGQGFTKIANPNPKVNNLHPNAIIKDLKLRYRKNNSLNDVYLYEFARASSVIGVDEVLDAPFIYAHETADKFLDYKRKRLALTTKTLSLDVGQAGQGAERGDAVTVVIPSLGISSDWEVTRSDVTIAGINSLALIPFTSNPYTYVTFVSEGGTLPIDESFDIQPDFTTTNPDPISNLSVSMNMNTVGVSPYPFALLTWTLPEDNYGGAVVSIKLSTDGAASYRDLGTYDDSARVEGLTPGLNYDFRVVSLNVTGEFKGLAVFDLTNLAGGDSSSPSTPTGLTGVSKFGRLIWTFTKSVSSDVWYHEAEVYSAASGGTRLYRLKIWDDDDPRVEFERQTGDLTSALTGYCQVRAVDFSKNEGSFTSRVVATTANVVRDDIDDNATMDIAETHSNSEKPGISQTSSVWYTVLADTITTDRTGIIKIRYNGQWVDDGVGFELRLKRGGGVLKAFDYGGNVNGADATLDHAHSVSSGTHTYTVETRNTAFGGTGLGLINNSLSIQGDFK